LAQASRTAATPFEDFLRRIIRQRCRSQGDPSISVDMSCNVSALGQGFGPDNEIAIAVDPRNPEHLLAGSNDYYYRFTPAGTLATVPTGFFTSFDGGKHWIDGQVPFGEGNNAGDPAPAFDAKHRVALMAQLDFTSEPARAVSTNGNIAVSRSTDGGRRWKRAVVVMRGRGPDTSESQIFWDKEYITVDNYPDSPHYGRIYVTATRFFGGPNYRDSAIYLSYSDDGGRTWSRQREISGSHPSCSFQTTGPSNECDESQLSYPEVAADGTLHVHFANFQNEAEWEVPLDFDGQIMVVTSTDGGRSFGDPVPVVQVEDGFSDMPYSVIGSQTIWGHQIRWIPYGTITANPANPEDIVIVFADRGAPNHNADDLCVTLAPEPPDYDPCRAGPGLDTDVFLVRSTDAGETWSGRRLVDGAPGSQWFPWADHGPDGKLAVAYDEDLRGAPADRFNHVLWVEGDGKETLRPNTAEGRTPAENPDISVTHWAGQVVGPEEWPRICGPAGYSEPPFRDARGKDCNYFHGDYTGLAIGSDGSINVTWTGLNRVVHSPQIDPYTGRRHDGYAQDAMFARR
jgi:hypothetical protein